MAALLYISTSDIQEPKFLHIFANTCIPVVVVVIAILVSVKWCLIVVLICISLMASDDEHFMWLLAGHLYIFFEDMSIQVFGPFKNWIVL